MENNQYPSHDINPKEKNEEWVMCYIKAAWDEYTKSGIKMFYNNRVRYAEIKDYVLGKQSADKYKKSVSLDDTADSSWLNLDWSIRPVAAKLRDIAISKLVQRSYNIVATPIDAAAHDETETYYATHKAKMKMREMAEKINPELAQLPALLKQYGDPENLDELEMMKDTGVKLKVAMEAEMGIEYVFYNNNYKSIRCYNDESAFDYGVEACKEYVDENGEVCVREVDIASLVVSNCLRADFKDARHIGEVIDVSVMDLPFDAETRKDIVNAARAWNSNWTNSVNSRTAFDSQKVQVLDMEFLSTNERVYEQRENKAGNEVYRRTEYNNGSKDLKVIINGEEKPKYIKKPLQVVYRGKWIIGTDYIYDAGPVPYAKRSKPNKAVTSLSYHIIAYNFHRMRALGIMERLIPIIDEYHNTIFKLENFKAKWVPYIINIDLQAMENVALGSGGGNMSEKEILELVFQNFVALGRRMDVSGNLQNYKMVDIEPTGMHQEFTTLANDLARLLTEMRDVTGLNDLTDGSTPGERTLNYVASLGNEATNNALYPLTRAGKALTESVAKGVIQRLVLTIQKGNIEGVIRTLGDETVKFIQVTKDIADRVWDIKLEDRPTDAQREALIQQMNIKESQGLILPDDLLMISETQNLKQAKAQLSYSIKKRKKENEEYELMKMQKNGEIQTSSAVAVEKARQETLKLEYDLKLKLELALKEKEKELLLLKLQSQEKTSETNAATRLVSEGMKASQPGF